MPTPALLLTAAFLSNLPDLPHEFLGRYLDLGWGASRTEARRRFPDLHEQDPSTLCRDDAGSSVEVCLFFDRDGLDAIDLTFKRPRSILADLLRRYGMPDRDHRVARLDGILYTWHTPQGRIRLFQVSEQATLALSASYTEHVSCARSNPKQPARKP